MNKRAFIFLLSVVVITIGTACKKPYLPHVVDASVNYLVVQGVVNAGSDSTFIQISRTVKLSSQTAAAPEANAIVNVESDNGVSYPLIEQATGRYASPGLNLDATHKYRLRIKTSDAKVYLSDLVNVENSPPIDSVNFVIASNGLNINVNTHDVKNNTRYYRWEYQETWIIRSFYHSHYVSTGDTVVPRDDVHNSIWQCWQKDTSSNIILASSARLANDVISQSPIIFISSESEKLSVEYSILVKQYALSSDAFSFWQNIKKNTEQIGTIFDVQPSEISGNIHCLTDPSEPVIGYLSVGSTVSKRVFISQRNLPAWSPILPYTFCQLVKDCCLYDHQTIDSHENQVDIYMNPGFHENNGPYYIPIDGIGQVGAPPIGFTTTSDPICVDCTIRGTNKQPDYWVFQ